VRRRGPSHLYTKTEPAALRNFDTFCKTTFATVSANSGHCADVDNARETGRAQHLWFGWLPDQSTFASQEAVATFPVLLSQQ
jgi:hypothetical protein